AHALPLPVLAEAGVVDAGGQGLVYILEGIWRSLRGETAEAAVQREAHIQMAHAPEGQYNYDTQFIIKGQGMDVEAIRQAIAEMGDSVLVVGDAETIKVHVHSDHPGQVLEYGLSQGQVTDVVIENMQLQYEAFLAAQRQTMPNTKPTQGSAPIAEIGIVAVASGDGLQTVLESLGVHAIIPGGQTMNPSTQDILEAIQSLPCEKVIVLPNNGNILLAAEQAKALADRTVAIVPTRTIPQGIAALLAFNYQADLEANVAAMTQAAAQVQTIEVTRAVRSAQVNGLAIQEGQFIGLLNDDLKTVGQDCLEVIFALLENIQTEEYEIVTIYYGQDVSEDDAYRIGEAVRERYASLEVEVLRGGQPYYHYIISLE
ncbi:MAG: DAK2 domain-containing protein, partial [Chloroflexi bacterium]|nr:DAK2 domain-containing protein [Chloroflexota bacterium]